MRIMQLFKRFIFSHNGTRRCGFSMLELSIVLVIIAVLAGGTIIVGNAKTQAAKYEHTNKKLDIIEKALASYLAINGRLPCPADGSLVDATGDEAINTAPDPAVCTQNADDGNVWMGVVPVRALQLPSEFMLDGWNRRISYVVDQRFVNNATTNANCDGSTSTACFKYTDNGSITVRTTIGGGLANIRTTEAVYGLISHGENGHGAWLNNNNTQLDADSTDTDEWANSHRVAAEGGAFDSVFIQKPRTATFDDLVRYRIKWQLVREAGAVLNDTVCAVARNVIDDTPDTVCSGSSYGNCENYVTVLSSQINDLCLQ